jgi:hypothetical protein
MPKMKRLLRSCLRRTWPADHDDAGRATKGCSLEVVALVQFYNAFVYATVPPRATED